ncbi:ATP-binding protein [Streptomyces sp. XM4193]|uniref:ATP-binding protein n=1 Tax=Streptomyces sp. XM4193 TaxID=2929782 RepID=UPI0035ABC6E3
MTAQITNARQRTERSPLRSALVPMLVTALLTGAGAAVTTWCAPADYRTQVAFATGLSALLLCTAAVVVAVQRARQRALLARLAENEAGSRSFAEQTLPALLDRLRSGSAPDSALKALPQPSSASHQQVLRTVAQELGRSEAGKAAALTACADAASRMQALSTSMLADLREMEHQHADEDVLADLLHLDHRTAQAGRLADSIAVLTGARSGRRWAKPIVMESILRGAMGRIAGYQRVRLHTTVDVAIAGHAAEGVMHALAELLDNAANFSPPTAEVHVYVEEVPAGLVVTIEDSGLVMGDFALRRAERAVSGESLDLTTLSGTRLGLPVVGCLARKHGLAVSFRPSARGGTGVIVRIPQLVIHRAQEHGSQSGARYVPVGRGAEPVGGSARWAGPRDVTAPDAERPSDGTPLGPDGVQPVGRQQTSGEQEAVPGAAPATGPGSVTAPGAGSGQQADEDPLFGPLPGRRAGSVPGDGTAVPGAPGPVDESAAPGSAEPDEATDRAPGGVPDETSDGAPSEDFPLVLPKRVSTLRRPRPAGGAPADGAPAGGAPVEPAGPAEPDDEHARAHDPLYQDHDGLAAGSSPDELPGTGGPPSSGPLYEPPGTGATGPPPAAASGTGGTGGTGEAGPAGSSGAEPYSPHWFREEAERIRRQTFGGVEPRRDDVWAAGAPASAQDPPSRDPSDRSVPPQGGSTATGQPAAGSGEFDSATRSFDPPSDRALGSASAQSAVPYGGWAPAGEFAAEPEYGPSGLPKRRRGQALSAARPATPPPAPQPGPRRTAAESAARFGAFRKAVRGGERSVGEESVGEASAEQTRPAGAEGRPAAGAEAAPDAPPYDPPAAPNSAAPQPPAPPTSYSQPEDDVR